ncbi:glycosyltransferase [Flavobacterium sp.]|uniref:glycosyltransferase n=1 Tax=Flavobacterium sp. TaxID=239 RepID=UPI0025DFB3E9|nr:glycosyltransferase [Flavobacterium sp.]
MTKILFIGPINYSKRAYSGAPAKNQHLLSFLNSKYEDVKFIDTINFRKEPFTLFKIFFQIVFFQNRKIIFSTSAGSTYVFVKFLFKFKIKRNLIFWVIGGDLGKHLLNRVYDPKYFTYFQSIIVEGDSIKLDLERCGLNNVFVIPNFKKIFDLPSKKTDTNYLKFVFISRIMPEKGADLILECAKRLNQMGISFTIDFFGQIDNNYENSFFNKLKNLNNVNYKGFLDLSCFENYKELTKYDVMLFPTYFKGEGFPGILIDAFIAGLPIISSNWNINPEIVENNYTGLLIESENPDALMNAMLLFVNKEVNIINMSKNCQKRAMDFKIENVLNNDILIQIGLK